MNVIKEEKTEVKVEQSGHEGGVTATVSKDGKSGKAKGKDAQEAISGPKDKAKGGVS